MTRDDAVSETVDFFLFGTPYEAAEWLAGADAFVAAQPPGLVTLSWVLLAAAVYVRPGLRRRADATWLTAKQDDLPQAIREFKAALPGWWYSVCECQVSCDATCAPTVESPHIALAEHGNAFDHGFMADLPQPSTLAQALREVMRQALFALADAPLGVTASEAELGPGNAP